MCRCHRPLAIFWACGRVKPPAGQPGKLQGCELVRIVKDGVLVGSDVCPPLPQCCWVLVRRKLRVKLGSRLRLQEDFADRGAVLCTVAPGDGLGKELLHLFQYTSG